jgi:predicted O-linked N-acetylglucosamine transferase (SPINDLY family)
MTMAAEMMTMAVQHHQAGRLDEAIAMYRQVLSEDAANVVAFSNLGAALQQQGRLEEAAGCYERALALAPDLVEALGNLGTVRKQQGKSTEAEASYRRALALRPGSAVVHCDLGVVLQEQGRLDEAIASYRRAIELDPGLVQALFNLGTALKSAGDIEGAITCYRQAVALRPAYVEALCNLGNALKDQDKLEEAISCYQRAMQIAPNYAEAYNNLAGVLQQQGKLTEAVAWYQGALLLSPNLAEAHSNLGTVYREQGRPDEAVAAHRRAIELRPDYAEAWNHLGTALKDKADLDGAMECYQRGLALRPQFLSIHSNLLFTMQFSERFDAAAIFEEHRRFDELHTKPLARFMQAHHNDRSVDRRLRIGYVSPDFFDHCQAFFTMPLLGAHDRERVEVFCYADVVRADAMTERIKPRADVWRNITGLSTQQRADLVREDRIDILVDLTMHMNRQHLTLLARKPAPVQVCWLAYPGTTGLSAIDYRLTDPHLDPPGLFDRYYAEESVRLPDTFWCYDPLTREPAVNRLPALGNGYVTFGSLNNFCKVNDTTLGLWAKVLKAVDRSRLILLADEGSHRERTLEVFEQHGVERQRITFFARHPRPQYLALYHGIDLGLDTLPYNGHTTSLDAYWMGVPVVTLVGTTVVGRAGLSQLTNLGLSELIAETPEQFVQIASQLAGDLERLSRLRQTLRGRMESSPLMDAPRFARGMERAYGTMWQRWCESVGR